MTDETPVDPDEDESTPLVAMRDAAGSLRMIRSSYPESPYWSMKGVEGDAIEWDEHETFYAHIPCIQYRLVHFLAPWGYMVRGKVSWQGEDPEDAGIIIVENNTVYTRKYERVLRLRVAYTQEEDES